MRIISLFLILCFIVTVCAAQLKGDEVPLGASAPPIGEDDHQFPRGATPTSEEKIAAAPVFIPTLQAADQFAIVPAHLQYWGNDRYGICVTAEEAFAKLAYSKQCGDEEIRITDSDCIAWARKHGVLNGAQLLDVMQMAAKDGLPANGKLYTTGVPHRVNYKNEEELRSALLIGPVKIGIQAGDLPKGAGSKNGWWSIRNIPGGREDHAVALCGFGPASYLYGELGLPVPEGLPADKQGYLLFTWSTIGFVSHDFLLGSVDEAWVRVPTTVGETPKPPVPPTPVPVPTPKWVWLVIILLLGIVVVISLYKKK